METKGMFFLLTGVLLTAVWAVGRGEVVLVERGQGRAVIVTAAQPTAVARYAAEELRYYVAKATGVELEIMRENSLLREGTSRVYVGDCGRARAVGIKVEELTPDSFILCCRDKEFFLVGRDGEGNPLDMRTWAGSLFAVYELLDTVMRIRWLWPGELGEFVPKTDTVIVPDTDKKVEPWLLWRNLRSTLHFQGTDSSGFSPEAYQKAVNEQAMWLRRHRMGYSVNVRYGHAFTDWWERYGKEHPEWFNLLEDGKRHGGGSMCVSNPGFHQQIVENWKSERAKNPGKFLNFNCCENDCYGMCRCANCRAWDGPQRKVISERFGGKYGIVSTRYAKFWQAVQSLASKTDPNVVIMGYAYVNYLPDPGPVELNKNIWIGYVPDVFFPRSAEEHNWVKEQWMGWTRTGCRPFLRPNYFLDGYCMPYIFAHQFGDEFLFDAKHGMIGTDFDSLTAMWATQGTNLYLLGRLHMRPFASVDEVLQEYYAGFGAAGSKVKAYFDYWERYTTKNRERFRALSKKYRAGWLNFPAMAHEAFPPKVFEPAFKLLDEAARMVSADREASARVEFLRKGLEHALLCVKVGELIISPERRRFSDLKRLRQLREQLQQYRKLLEKDNVANLNFCAWLESQSWQRQRVVEYCGEPLQPLAPSPAPLSEPKTLPVRQPHGFVAMLSEGEPFKAKITCRQIGRYENRCEWTLFGPGQEKPISKGTVKPNGTVVLEVPAKRKGVYNLIVTAGSNVSGVTLLNDHAVLTGQSLHFLGEVGPIYFYVPQGTESFTITLRTPAPGETARMTIFDPEGKETTSGFTGKTSVYKAEVEVGPKHSGRAWSLVIGKAPEGVLEDVEIILDDLVPGYWAIAPDRLLVPAE